MFYADYFLIDQIIEVIYPPENIANYVCKNREVKFHRQRYDTSTGQFLGLYETIGHLFVRSDDKKHFLNYGFCKVNSKILYSYHTRRIQNSFGRTLFNRHHLLFGTGQLKTNFSNLCFFYLRLPIETKQSISI